jgi:hypothetical protein
VRIAKVLLRADIAPIIGFLRIKGDEVLDRAIERQLARVKGLYGIRTRNAPKNAIVKLAKRKLRRLLSKLSGFDLRIPG